jgi:hypothetical protein
MFTRRFLAAALGAAILAVAATGSLGAWSGSHRTTYVTFNHEVALPGIQLSPGTYIFELASPEQHKNLVRVLSRDRKTIYLTQFTLTVQRPANLNPKRMISFHEAPRGQAVPVNAWFPEYEDTGRQFIYR